MTAAALDVTLPVFAAAAALAAGAAGACEMVYMEGRESMRFGTCGITYFDDGIEDEGVSAAVDLGKGYVQQVYWDGHACAARQTTIVVDCNADQAAIFGPSGLIEFPAPIPPGQWTDLQNAVEAASAAGAPLPLTEIVARASGLNNAAIVPVSGRAIGISNHGAPSDRRFDLGCGCKAYYPGSAGAK